MNDKRLKLLLKASLIFLAAAVIFCIIAVCASNRQEKHNGEQNVIIETEEPAPSPTEEPAPSPTEEPTPEPTETAKTVIVLDAGHGKSSSQMTDDEKIAEGYEYNASKGGWGEWRHYKNGTFGEDCYGSGCTGLCPQNGSCWYPIGNGDRDTEPTLNLNNALAAQKYLEQMGYEVRMTRTSNDQNPSMDKRVSYCFPNNDITLEPDAAVYVCIHSNAGGGRGTSYISLNATYTQSYIPDNYISLSNSLGEIINSKVAAATGLSENAPINTPYLILFNKSPVPIAYMEIGFFDSTADLEILQSSSDAIGKAIAEGVDEYLQTH
ncbi:MAG: N-acetylmuramoyl-L-alanine amidase [Firmicutes bacterium]|nr:N-acetylmuramoyl-L-alanine amidase [Bacillota bacterium]